MASYATRNALAFVVMAAVSADWGTPQAEVDAWQLGRSLVSVTGHHQQPGFPFTRAAKHTIHQHLQQRLEIPLISASNDSLSDASPFRG